MVFFDPANRAELDTAIANRQTPACLWFRLEVENPVVHQCTEPNTPQPGSVFFFSNHEGAEQQVAPTQSLAVHDKVSASDVMALADERLAAVISTRDARQPTFAFVCIALADLLTSTDTAVVPDFVIRFAARETYWKYYLIANTPPEQLDVRGSERDSAGDLSQVDFVRGTEVLPDGRACSTFTSTSSIALRERSTEKMALRNAHTDSVIFERLPTPSPQNLRQETFDGRQVTVSNIFVNL